MRKVVEFVRGTGVNRQIWHIQVEVPDAEYPRTSDARVLAAADQEARRLAEEHAYPTAPGMPQHTNGEGWKFSKVLDRFPSEDDADVLWAIAAGADFTDSPLLERDDVQEHLRRPEVIGRYRQLGLDATTWHR